METPGLFGDILNAISPPIFIKDRRHRWLYVNDAFCSFIGRKRNSVIGKSDSDCFPEEQAGVFWAKEEQVFKSGKENTNEESLTDSSGVLHSIVMRRQLFRAKGGRDLLVGVVNDITETKKAHTSLSLFRRLMEKSNDTVYIIDPENGAFLDVNDTACSRLGYPREKLLKMRVKDINKVPGAWEKLSAQVLATGSVVAEGIHTRADGTAFPVEISSSLAEVDGKKYFLANVRDISDRKKAEAAVKEVRELEGLIPICSKCKKIRDDKGFWKQVEIYVAEHSGVRFTHSLCTDCLDTLYTKKKQV